MDVHKLVKLRFGGLRKGGVYTDPGIVY